MGNIDNSYKTIHILIIFNLLLASIAFLKDIVLAAYFGTSNIADSINLAFFLPDTIGNNLIGAAIAVATIPVLTKLTLNESKSHYFDVIKKIALIIFVSTIVLFGLLIIFSKQILTLFSIDGNQIQIVKDYFFILAPIIFIAPLWLLGSSVLQASRRFIIPAATPIVFNVILLISLVIFQSLKIPQATGGITFSKVITVATFCSFIITWIYIYKELEFNWKLTSSSNYKDVKKIGTIFASYILILLFTQSALFVERLYASSLETGTVAALTYAYRLSQFPIWVFIAAVNTFILPTISLHLETRNFNALKTDLKKAFTFVIGVSGIISLILFFFSEPLLQLLLARGAFTSDSVKLTSLILKSYSLSIVGQSLYVFCLRYYVAEGKMRTPLIIGLIGSIINVVLLTIFVPSMGAKGIGYAVAVSATLSGTLLLIYFVKDLLIIGQRGVEVNE
ncbi:MAG: murJ 2 [Bacillales bacterium]|nr:murJ 2 [Bacillales bacterium]